jgi:hypothetical protein
MGSLLNLVLALTLAAPAAAQAAWQEDGRPLPEGVARATQQGFGVMMLTTDDDAEFMRAWEGPTPPHLVTTTRAARGVPLFAMVLFHDCRAGADGNCNVSAEFTILQPDGAVYGELMRGEIWRGPPAPPGSIRLGASGPALRVEPQDPMGTWKIRARITDHVRGLTIEVELEVTVDTPPTAVTA